MTNAARNEFTEEGMKKLIDANKNLDVLLIERNKVAGQKDKYKKKDLFLFYWHKFIDFKNKAKI